MSARFALPLLAAVLLLAQGGYAKVVENSFGDDPPYCHKSQGKPTWVFLAKFAFDKSANNVAGPPILKFDKLQVPDEAYNSTVLLVYDDEFASWEHIYNSNSMTCDERVAQSKTIGTTKGLKLCAIDGTCDQHIKEPAMHVTENSPHYWFVVLANCGKKHDRNVGLESIDFKLTFENPGGHWSTQFGYDIQGVIWIYVVFLVAFTAVMITACVGLYRMYADFHPVGDLVPFRPLLQLYVLSVFLELVAEVFHILHYSSYANDGQGTTGLQIGAEVLHGMSECTLIVLIIFISAGWNVNEYGITAKVVLFGVLAILYSLYVAMIVVGNIHAEMPTSVYIYDTIPGIILNCLRVFFAFILVAIFAWGAIKGAGNARAQQNQKSLMTFIFLVALWLVITPLCSLAVAFIADYDREKVAVSFECIAHFYGCSMLLWILWPGRIHDYFSVSDTSLSQSLGQGEYDGEGEHHRMGSSL